MRENGVGILMLGCRGAGKTAFLTGLSLLSRGGGGDGKFQVVPGNVETAEALLDLRGQADRGQWPPPTSGMKALEFELTYRGRSFNLFLLDYPGEAFQEAMETLDFEAREEIRRHAATAEYALLVADPTQDLRTSVNQTPETDTRRRQDALAQSVGYLFRDRRESNTPLPSIAVVMSKADLLQGLEESDGRAVLQNNAGFLQQVQNYSRAAPRIRIFPVSVCGCHLAADGGSFPLDARPEGYERLFDWMSGLDVVKRHRGKIWLSLSMGALVLLVLVGFWIWTEREGSKFEHLLELGPLDEIRGVLAQRGDLRDRSQRVLDARTEREMDAVESEIPRVTTDEALRRLDDRLATLGAMRQLTGQRRLNALRARIEALRESSLYDAITAAVRGGEDRQALAMISAYRQGFPGGPHLGDLAKLEASIADERRSALRGRVQSLTVTDRGGLTRKIGEIRQYLAAYPDDPDAEPIRAGLRLAEELSGADAVRLLVTACGFGPEPGDRPHEVRWAAGPTDEPALLFRQEAPVSTSTFWESIEIAPARWRPLRIELWSTPLVWPNSRMASAELSVLHDARRFDGKQRVPLSTDLDDWQDAGAWVQVQLQLRGPGGWRDVPRADLEAYGRFVLPGEAWR